MSQWLRSPTAPGYLALAQSLKGPATPRLCGLRRGNNAANVEWNPLYVDVSFLVKELSLRLGSLCLLLIPVCVCVCVSVKESLLPKPLPCNLSAETALRPLIWSSESLSARESFVFGGVFFHRHTHTHTHTHTQFLMVSGQPGSRCSTIFRWSRAAGWRWVSAARTIVASPSGLPHAVSNAGPREERG